MEKCDFVTRSVATRREVLLRNEKWLRSSCCLNTSKPFRRLRRLFSQRLRCTSRRTLVRHFSRHDPAALLGMFLATSRGFSNRTSRGTFPPLFSNVYSLLDGFTVTSRHVSCHFSQVSPALLAGSACTSRRLFRQGTS